MGAVAHTFSAQKKTYGGKHVQPGNPIYLFDSENEVGKGLCAKGVVVSSVALPRQRGGPRQTPRVWIEIERQQVARVPLG